MLATACPPRSLLFPWESCGGGGAMHQADGSTTTARLKSAWLPGDLEAYEPK